MLSPWWKNWKMIVQIWPPLPPPPPYFLQSQYHFTFRTNLRGIYIVRIFVRIVVMFRNRLTYFVTCIQFSLNLKDISLSFSIIFFRYVQRSKLTELQVVKSRNIGSKICKQNYSNFRYCL